MTSKLKEFSDEMRKVLSKKLHRPLLLAEVFSITNRMLRHASCFEESMNDEEEGDLIFVLEHMFDRVHSYVAYQAADFFYRCWKVYRRGVSSTIDREFMETMKEELRKKISPQLKRFHQEETKRVVTSYRSAAASKLYNFVYSDPLLFLTDEDVLQIKKEIVDPSIERAIKEAVEGFDPYEKFVMSEKGRRIREAEKLWKAERQKMYQEMFSPILIKMNNEDARLKREAKRLKEEALTEARRKAQAEANESFARKS